MTTFSHWASAPLSSYEWQYAAPVEQWKQSSEYLCGRCGGPVYVNPYHPTLLGCIPCNFAVKPEGYKKYLRPRT